MTRRTALVLFGLAVCLVSSVGERVGAAPVPKHLMKEPENPDLDALQGEWLLAGVVHDGTVLPAGTVREIQLTLEVRGTVMAVTFPKANSRLAATLKFDLNTNSRRLTFDDQKQTDLKDNPKNLADVEKWSAAIYKLEDDTFVLATQNGNTGGVPKDFVSVPGSDAVVLTFTRVKK
jgi:uncharacterized protein (TIGR03067 family)